LFQGQEEERKGYKGRSLTFISASE